MKEETAADELKLLQSKYKIDAQKSSSRGMMQQLQTNANSDQNHQFQKDN
jgi:hypothetical protein